MGMVGLKQVAERLGSVCKNTARTRVREGLITMPIKFGPSTRLWPEEEIDAIRNARIAGADDDEVRELVEALHARRAELRPTIRASVRDHAKKGEEHE